MRQGAAVGAACRHSPVRLWSGSMIDHVSSYTTQFEAARRFYDAALTALGYERNMEMVTTWDAAFPSRRVCAYGPGRRPVFWLTEVNEPASPRHIAFVAKDHAAVAAFHGACLEAGGKDNGAPGPRPIYHANYYGAFALDPDGNNVEAVCHQPS
jgi:catechol 2,3-dioxygenase-like lactoylglutathione lyase family enzyme